MSIFHSYLRLREGILNCWAIYLGMISLIKTHGIPRLQENGVRSWSNIQTYPTYIYFTMIYYHVYYDFYYQFYSDVLWFLLWFLPSFLLWCLQWCTIILSMIYHDLLFSHDIPITPQPRRQWPGVLPLPRGQALSEREGPGDCRYICRYKYK